MVWQEDRLSMLDAHDFVGFWNACHGDPFALGQATKRRICMKQQHLSRNQRERQVIETRQRERWLEEQAANQEASQGWRDVERQVERDSNRPERAAPPERRNQPPERER